MVRGFKLIPWSDAVCEAVCVEGPIEEDDFPEGVLFGDVINILLELACYEITQTCKNDGETIVWPFLQSPNRTTDVGKLQEVSPGA